MHEGYVADVVDAKCKLTGMRVALKIYSLQGEDAMRAVPCACVTWAECKQESKRLGVQQGCSKQAKRCKVRASECVIDR